MVVVMYRIALCGVFVTVILAATKVARPAKESLSEIKPVSSRPTLITSHLVRPDQEGVKTNV